MRKDRTMIVITPESALSGAVVFGVFLVWVVAMLFIERKWR